MQMMQPLWRSRMFSWCRLASLESGTTRWGLRRSVSQHWRENSGSRSYRLVSRVCGSCYVINGMSRCPLEFLRSDCLVDTHLRSGKSVHLYAHLPSIRAITSKVVWCQTNLPDTGLHVYIVVSATDTGYRYQRCKVMVQTESSIGQSAQISTRFKHTMS